MLEAPGQRAQLHPFISTQRGCHSESQAASVQPIIAYLVLEWDVLLLSFFFLKEEDHYSQTDAFRLKESELLTCTKK